jgi:hypothetical protein
LLCGQTCLRIQASFFYWEVFVGRVFLLCAGLWRDGEKVVFVCERRTNVRGTAEGVAKALFPRDDWLEGPVNSGFPFRRERDSLAITRTQLQASRKHTSGTQSQ